MPFLEFDISSMSETRAGLFQHAYDSLLLYQDNEKDLVTLKDALYVVHVFTGMAWSAILIISRHI